LAYLPLSSQPHPCLFWQNEAQVIEVNIEKVLPDADYFVMGKAGAALPRIVAEIKKIYESGAQTNPPQRPDTCDFSSLEKICHGIKPGTILISLFSNFPIILKGRSKYL
jgi:hypothetical protein